MQFQQTTWFHFYLHRPFNLRDKKGFRFARLTVLHLFCHIIRRGQSVGWEVCGQPVYSFLVGFVPIEWDVPAASGQGAG
jgi:hypothetical protein